MRTWIYDGIFPKYCQSSSSNEKRDRGFRCINWGSQLTIFFWAAAPQEPITYGTTREFWVPQPLSLSGWPSRPLRALTWPIIPLTLASQNTWPTLQTPWLAAQTPMSLPDPLWAFQIPWLAYRPHARSSVPLDGPHGRTARAVPVRPWRRTKNGFGLILLW